MSSVLVLAPAALAPEQPPAGAEVRTWADLGALLAALEERGNRPCVLVSDGLHADTEAAVAAAIRSAPGPVVEVRSLRWDGESPSPVSAACRGVISGFGAAGVAAAVGVLTGESA